MLTCSNYKRPATRWPKRSALLLSLVAGLLIAGCQLPLNDKGGLTIALLNPAVQASSANQDAEAMVEQPTAVALSTPEGQENQAPRASQEVERWPAAQGGLSLNTTVTGRLTADAGRLRDGTPFDLYTFEGATGTFITLTVTARAFDTYLALVAPDDTIVAFNDDAHSKVSTDSQLRLPLPATGRYQVWVNSFANAVGEYTLSLAATSQLEETRALSTGKPQQGWLIPGDTLNEAGLYADAWTLSMPDAPLVVQVTSAAFDTQLAAYTPDGSLLIANNDRNFVAGDGDARIVLAPSTVAPPGTAITVAVALAGEHAIGGAYQLESVPLPLTYEPQATLLMRPVIVKTPTQAEDRPLVSEAQVLARLARASEIWRTCGIEVQMAGDEAVEVIEIAGLQSPLEVEEGTRDWTADETRLQTHPTHATYHERLVTLYIVPDLDGGERYGTAYPSTRYPPSRSGLLLVAAQAMSDPASNVLAHEIGHILGLEHPNPVTGDGDPWNDGVANLMSQDAGGSDLTPLQCMVARGEAHYLHANTDEPLVPPAFARSDRILAPGESIVDALTTRNLASPNGPLFDVYYFAGKAGERMHIRLDAATFDPVLLLDGPDGERVAMNDDSGDGWQAEITVTLPQSGDYLIGVTSVEWAVGDYRLTLITAE